MPAFESAFAEIAALLLTAALIGALAIRLHQPLIVSFIAVGILVGPAGLGWVDEVVLLEETGRSLFPSPMISTLLAASVIGDIGSDEQRRRWLPGIADGSRIGSLALLDRADVWSTDGVCLTARREGDDFLIDGEKPFVVDANRADLLVVAFRSGQDDTDLAVAVVDGDVPGLEVTAVPTLDRTNILTLLFEITFAMCPAVPAAPTAFLAPLK